MTGILLLVGRLTLLVFVYLFLFVAVRTGIGLVSDATPRGSTWRLGLVVERGPKELRGIKLDLASPMTIGRDPEADLVIADDFVSSRHARVDPTPKGPVLEDLGSTNGTLLDGRLVDRPTLLKKGDTIEVGEVVLKVTAL